MHAGAALWIFARVAAQFTTGWQQVHAPNTDAPDVASLRGGAAHQRPFTLTPNLNHEPQPCTPPLDPRPCLPAEIYPVPPREETQGATERYIGSWLAAGGAQREDIVLATKVGACVGPGWVLQLGAEGHRMGVQQPRLAGPGMSTCIVVLFW